MRQYILNKLKENYGENFLQSNGPVYLLHELIGKKRVIEMGSIDLGSTEEEINKSFEEMFKTYPSDKFYCVYYTTVEYKSEKAKEEFLQKYYKGDSRIPETTISSADLNYTDSYRLRVTFFNKEEYERLPTCFDELYDFYNYSDQVVFYKYYDDFLYQREIEDAQKWAEKNNMYILQPINKKDFLIERYGFIRDLGKNIKKLKEATKEKLGDLFISWDTGLDICLRVNQYKGENYLIISESSKIHPDQYYKKDFKALKKLAIDKKFKTEKEVAQFFKDNITVQRQVIQPGEVTAKIYDDYTIVDMHDWLRLIPLPSEQQTYNMKNWGEAQAAMKDILNQNEKCK